MASHRTLYEIFDYSFVFIYIVPGFDGHDKCQLSWKSDIVQTEKQSGKILRLKNIIDKLLKSLNEMISLEIHAGMVLKIMKI